MNVRCLLMNGKTVEWFYPDSNEPRDLVTFWGTVEGYRLNKVPYEIEWGTGVDDDAGDEIFQGDVVKILHTGRDSGGIIHRMVDEIGIVDYFDGAYFIITPSGDAVEFGPVFEDMTQAQSLKIVNHRLTQPEPVA